MHTYSAEALDFGIFNRLGKMFPFFEKYNTIKAHEKAIKGIKSNQAIYVGVDAHVYSRKLIDALPAVNDAIKLAAGEGAAYIRQSRGSLLKSHHGNIIDLIININNNMMKDADAVVSAIERIYDKNSPESRITFYKTNFLIYCGLVIHYNDYTRRLLQVLANEILGNRLTDTVSVSDRTYVMDHKNIKSFGKAVFLFSFPFTEIQNIISTGQSFEYDEKTAHLVYSHNAQQADPLRLGLLPVIGDIALWYGKYNNLKLAARDEAAKEECQKLELTILMLKRRVESGVDTAEMDRIQKQIDYHSNRINKLRGSMELISDK